MRADPDQPHHEDLLESSSAIRSVFEESNSRQSSSSPTQDFCRKSPLRVTQSPPPAPPTSSSCSSGNSGNNNNNTPLLTASLNAPPQSYYSSVRVKSDLQVQLAKAQQQQQQLQQQLAKKFKSEEALIHTNSPHHQPSEVVSQSLSKQQSTAGSRSSSPYHNSQQQTAFYSSLLQQLRQQGDPVKGDPAHQLTIQSIKIKKEKAGNGSSNSSNNNNKPLPFMCPACKKRFQRHIALNAHFQNEHISPPGPNGGERTCRLCVSTFSTLGAVRHHLVVAHNIHLDSPTKCLDEAYRPPHAAAVTTVVQPGAKYSVLEASLRSGLINVSGSGTSTSSSSDASNGSESVEPSCSSMEGFGEGSGGSGRSSPQQSDFSSVARPLLSPVPCNSLSACSSTDRSPERSVQQLRLRGSGGQHDGAIEDLKTKGYQLLINAAADVDNAAAAADDDEVHVEDLSMRRPVCPSPVALMSSRRYSPAPRQSARSSPPLASVQPSQETATNMPTKKRPRTSSTSEYSPVASSATPAAAASAGGKFTCNSCSIVFPNQTLYFLHRGFHSEANPWRCNACGHLSTDLYDFNTHLYSVAHL